MGAGQRIHQRVDGRYEARYKKGLSSKGATMYGTCYGRTYEEAYRKREQLLNAPENENLRKLNSGIENMSESLDVLSEEQVRKLENELLLFAKPSSYALYFVLELGISIEEACALRYEDIDYEKQQLVVDKHVNIMENNYKKETTIYPIARRVIPLPNFVHKLLKDRTILKLNSYIATDHAKEYGTPDTLIRHLKLIGKRCIDYDNLTPMVIRNTFIRRCLECSIGLNTIASIMGLPPVLDLPADFSKFIFTDHYQIMRLERFQPGYEKQDNAKHMNILILGAGGQGHVVKETVQAIGAFEKIAFLDDDLMNPEAIDTCTNYYKYLDEYPIAYPSFGNNELRMSWIDKLERYGFILPILIHPAATVSPSATIGSGSIIEAKSIVSANVKIEKGCILSSGAVINHSATIESGCHIGSAAIVSRGAVIASKTKFTSVDIHGNII